MVGKQWLISVYTGQTCLQSVDYCSYLYSLICCLKRKAVAIANQMIEEMI